MKIEKSCSWCQSKNDISAVEARQVPVYCSNCGHRADVSRMACDCHPCRSKRVTLTGPPDSIVAREEDGIKSLSPKARR
jgi:Zn finger protein HypA/HybF involved in hydrogenase expression